MKVTFHTKLETHSSTLGLGVLQAKVQQEAGLAPGDSDAAAASEAGSREEADTRSIYVGNVDYSCTPEELQVHFQVLSFVDFWFVAMSVPFSSRADFVLLSLIILGGPLQGCGTVNRVTILTDKFGTAKVIWRLLHTFGSDHFFVLATRDL